VWDVTAAHVHPDRNHALAAIPANTRPGAASPNNAVLICDDGGHNGFSGARKTTRIITSKRMSIALNEPI
jgi:hypothetical protein